MRKKRTSRLNSQPQNEFCHLHFFSVQNFWLQTPVSPMWLEYVNKYSFLNFSPPYCRPIVTVFRPTSIINLFLPNSVSIRRRTKAAFLFSLHEPRNLQVFLEDEFRTLQKLPVRKRFSFSRIQSPLEWKSDNIIYWPFPSN